MPERGDPASRLHSVLYRCGVVTEEGGGGVDVGDDVRDSPQRRRTLTRRLRRADDLDDDLSEPKEDLADGSSTEFAVPFPPRMHANACQTLHRPAQIRREQHRVINRDHAVRVHRRRCRGHGRPGRWDAVEIVDRNVGRQTPQ